MLLQNNGFMNLSETRNIVIAQALEESDTGGRLVSDDEKRIAESAAGAPLPQTAGKKKQDQFLAKRAQGIIGVVESRLEGDINWLRSNPFRTKFSLFALITIIVAAVVGYLTNELDDPNGQINILKFPIIGIIVWSLLVYLFELLVIFRKNGASSGLAGIITKALFPPPVNLQKTDNEPNVEFRARSLFLSRWRHLNIPPISSRVKALLHFTALILAAAAIVGMYVKGIAKEYNAVWESTFIEDGKQLQPVLKTVLGPAMALKKSELPTQKRLDDMKGPDAAKPESARDWIHWYAITIGIYVLIPRFFLGIVWLLRSKSAERNMPFKELSPAYYERVLAVSTGDGLAVAIVPYAHKPGDNVIQGIRTYMEGFFERPVTISWQDAISFGDEDDAKVTMAANFQPMILFNFASTPERETHLALYQSLVREITGGKRYQVILDCEAFDRKSESFNDADDRRNGRLDAWKKLFAAENCEIHVISEHLVDVKEEKNG